MSNQIKICPTPIISWNIPRLHPPKLVAIAKDAYLEPKTRPFADYRYLPYSTPIPKYGQDITYGYNRPAPGNRSVGTTEAELKPKMRRLLDIFAGGDQRGREIATRLFDRFLAKQNQATYFEDDSLNAAASGHPNIWTFCKRAISAPLPGWPPTEGKTRIHQALRNADWDIKKIIAPTDLGVPAFNRGFDLLDIGINRVLSFGDFSNGLGVMINGVQYVYVVAQNYYHEPSTNKYYIMLKFIFYDVFGLDDDDLQEYGLRVTPAGNLGTDAMVGITAWWQLQHQHGYAPLVTRIVLNVSYEVPAI